MTSWMVLSAPPDAEPLFPILLLLDFNTSFCMDILAPYNTGDRP